MVEVLIEDFGYEKMGKHVTKPLDSIKIAGYVGCQTNRPFGIDGGSDMIVTPLPGLPDECRGLPGPHQPEVQDPLQNAGGVLFDIDECSLRRQRQGSGSGWTDHQGQAAGRDRIEVVSGWTCSSSAKAP
jgi:hypothetical protein